jgi:hypothetical protein
LKGRKPDKKPFGRDSAPKGYPKDPDLYADPNNWRYPLHTSWNAKAARRYFDEPPNRAKYTEDEQAYIDWRIDEALKRFAPSGLRGAERPSPKAPARKKIEQLSLNELFRIFLGAARLKRAAEIQDSLMFISNITPERIDANVKDYVVHVDLKNRTISHDCQDWRRNMESKNMCKHLGKLLLGLEPSMVMGLLQDILKHKDEWKFTAP